MTLLETMLFWGLIGMAASLWIGDILDMRRDR